LPIWPVLHPHRDGWYIRRRTISPFVVGESPWLCMLGAERTGLAGVLDQPTPPLLPAVGTGNRPAAGSVPSSSQLVSAHCHACRRSSPPARWLPRPTLDAPTTRSPGTGPRLGAGCGHGHRVEIGRRDHLGTGPLDQLDQCMLRSARTFKPGAVSASPSRSALRLSLGRTPTRK
jgi:hypothetical protein